MPSQQRYLLAVDIGGTFTDLVVLDGETGDLLIAKVLTSFPDPSVAVVDGVNRLLAEGACVAEGVSRTIHGTTLVTNALIERRGAPTGLITTEGFRDALEIGREGRYDIYDLFLELPKPLVERRLRFEIPERVKVTGEVFRELDEAAVERACEALREAGVEAVAICFLHSYIRPDHEQRAGEIVREALPGRSLSVSHQVAPEMREYERTSTTVANAYVQPLADRYLEGLENGLDSSGLKGPLHIMISNAGTCSVDTAKQFPVRLVESGPCGGALAARYWGRAVGEREILAFDMGGTTAKAVLSRGGEFPISGVSEVARVYRFKRGSGLPLLVPVLDLVEIGAGGGSLARVNELGLPQVGPESAGAVPGPACYGGGMEEPTVTDADLFLGYLNPSFFLGGRMRLDVAAAEAALGGFAEKLKTEVYRAAWGIHRLVNENMANAARVHAAERGVDLRDFTMVATGGAGPLHCCGVSELIGVGRVVVPPAAGVGSAFGLMLAPISFDFSRSSVVRLETLRPKAVQRLFSDLEDEGRKVVADAGVAPSAIGLRRSADMRYAGQGHEIRVELPDRLTDEFISQELTLDFEAEYKRIYGRNCPGVPVEAVHWRVTAFGPEPSIGKVRAVSPSSREGAEKGPRPALFAGDDRPRETPVYNRYSLEVGFSVSGPAIVEEEEATTVVAPDWRLSVHQSGCLVLSKEGSVDSE